MKKFKEICRKIADIIKVIYGYGMFVCLFVGGLSFFGYLAALIIGGDTASQICTFIYKGLYPYLIKISSVMILFGLVKMYLCGEIALRSKK